MEILLGILVLFAAFFPILMVIGVLFVGALVQMISSDRERVKLPSSDKRKHRFKEKKQEPEIRYLPPPLAPEGVVCQVCGEAIGGKDEVHCGSCGTPHHKDCWDYIGQCSTYNCRCRTYKED